MNKDVILIMAAMKDVELNVLLDKLELENVYEEKSCTFYEGKIYNKNVVVVHINVGMVNSAIATTLGIKRYNPKAIFIEGTAGGHGVNVHKGDIVVSTGTLNMNSIETEFKDENEGSHPLKWKLRRFGHMPQESDEIVIDASQELINVAKEIESDYLKNNDSVTIHYGIVGSGDIWNKEIDMIKRFANEYKTLCEDMESGAAFQVSKIYNVPILAVRVISNNEIHRELYDRTLGAKSQEYVLEIIKNGI